MEKSSCEYAFVLSAGVSSRMGEKPDLLAAILAPA